MSFLPPAYSDSNDIFSSRLKRIQDALRKNFEEQFQVDELDLEDANATSYSVLKYIDKYSFAIAKSVTGTGDEMPEEPDMNYVRFLYRFDHRGNTLYDQSHFNSDGEIHGEPKFMLGIDWNAFGGELAWDMDGSNDYARIPTNSNLEITGLTAFSFVFLIFPRDLSLKDSVNRVIMSHQEDPANAWAKKIELGTDGKLYFSLIIAGQNRLFETPASSFTVNNWQWGIVTFNEYASPKCTAYVNGVAKTVISSAHNPNFLTTDDNDMLIGVASVQTVPNPYDAYTSDFNFNEEGELSPNGLLILRKQGVNPNVATDVGKAGVRTPAGRAFPKVLYMYPYAGLGAGDVVYDTFPTAYDLTTDPQTSPDGKWKMLYHGSNPDPAHPGDPGKTGVRIPASPTGGFARVLYAYPYLLANSTATATAASIVLSNPTYYGDFDVTFSLRTKASRRTPTPQAWECVWFMWHFNEADGTNFHHYYLALKTNGHLEVGRKDNSTQTEHQYYLLGSEPTFTFAYGAWNKVRVKSTANHIEIWIDDVKKVDIVDDGTVGSPNTDRKSVV